MRKSSLVPAAAFAAFAPFAALAAPASAQDRPAKGEGAEKKERVTEAVCVIQPFSGSAVKGLVYFIREGEDTRVKGEISGLTPGKHGFHIHEFGNLTSADATSAGGHFNPEGTEHGGPEMEMRHAGDFGNVEAGADGVAKIDFVDKEISFKGRKSILGRALVVHANEDDLKTQPTGNAGARVGAGVIGVSKIELE